MWGIGPSERAWQSARRQLLLLVTFAPSPPTFPTQTPKPNQNSHSIWINDRGIGHNQLGLAFGTLEKS